jgi:hypothetical protein
MGRPWFDGRLMLVPQYDPDTGDTNPSPLAKGEIDPGDIIKWLAVWVHQVKRSAAAAGRSEYGQEFQNRWEVKTFLVKGSDDFDTDEPALAQALALIWRGGDENRREFYWWIHPVILETQ